MIKRIMVVLVTLVHSSIHAQHVGIGAAQPQARLHVSNGTLANAQYHLVSNSIFEQATPFIDGSIQLVNPSSRAFSIFSGTEVAIRRSSISFLADSSVTVETGGLTAPRLKIDKTGVVSILNRVGIGTSSPVGRLHVLASTPLNDAQHFGLSHVVFENSSLSSDASIQLVNPSSRAFSIFSGTELAARRSSISFQPDSSLTLETGASVTPRIRVDKTGVVTIPNRIGIGNTAPFGRLHVNASTSLPDAQYFGLSHIIFENSSVSSDASMQLMNPSVRGFSIFSGTELTSRRSSVSFQADSSVTIETGGTATQRMKIDKLGTVSVPGRISINNNTPAARLHVNANTALADAQYFGLSHVVFENSSTGADASIQLMNSSLRTFSILSGTELTPRRSSLSFREDSSVSIETGGGNRRVTITDNGLMGVNTTTPAARLDVNGTAIIGTNGTILTEVIKTTVNKDVASVAAGSSVTELFTIPDAQVTSTVYLSPAGALPNGLVIGYARVFPAGTVEVRFTNITGAAINPAVMDFYITVIR